MNVISSSTQEHLKRASWIRKMFEEGAKLKAEFGAEAVCDFSLGNPDLPPPAQVSAGLAKIAAEINKPFALGYMANAGYEEVRAKLAAYLSFEQNVVLTAQDVILTCGAAGGLNVFFKTVFEPGDELVCPAPYFVEYGFYVQNHQGVLKPVPTKGTDFRLDLSALAAAITPKTRAVLVNSPNNPTGQVYKADELHELAGVLFAKTKEFGRPIFLLSDEPYRFLTYDGTKVPPVLPTYEFSAVISSFSKNLSLAGERIGYVALNPAMPGKQELMAGLIFANRVLGFVNASAIGQKLILHALGASVDVSVYAGRRKAMQEVLEAGGYSFSLPKGGFYFFPEAPGGDDVKFVNLLLEEKILAVPGSGFGCPGFFRLAYCTGEDVIRRAKDGFARARAKVG